MDYARTDAALAAFQPPQALALRDIAIAARLHRNGAAATRAAGRGEQRVVTPGRRRVNGSAQTFAQPKLLAGVRIIGDEAIREIHDQFLASARFDNQRCAPGCPAARTASSSPAASNASRPAAGEIGTGQRRVQPVLKLLLIQRILLF